jgi:hypothetical protein
VAVYKIIFKGEVTSDGNRVKIEAALAKFFKIPVEKASVLFNGKAYALKKGLEVDKAISMQQKFSKIGVVTHLVKEEVVVEDITTQEPVDSETLEPTSSEEVSNENELNQESKDIWLALKTTATFIGLISAIACILVYFIIAPHEKVDGTLIPYLGWIVIINIASAKFTWSIWQSYYLGVITDVNADLFSFPASDVENSVKDILTFKKFRNLAKRNSFPITQIRALNNETKRWTTKSTNSKGQSRSKNHVSWLLNVSGDFGSQQFEFSSKQKRDECRSMLFMATRRLGNTSRGSSDFNFDG